MRNSYDIFRSHFKCLILKRYNYLKKDKKGIFAELVIPIIIVLFAFGISSI